MAQRRRVVGTGKRINLWWGPNYYLINLWSIISCLSHAGYQMDLDLRSLRGKPLHPLGTSQSWSIYDQYMINIWSTYDQYVINIWSSCYCFCRLGIASCQNRTSCIYMCHFDSPIDVIFQQNKMKDSKNRNSGISLRSIYKTPSDLKEAMGEPMMHSPNVMSSDYAPDPSVVRMTCCVVCPLNVSCCE